MVWSKSKTMTLGSNIAAACAVGVSCPPFCYWHITFLRCLYVYWQNLCFHIVTISLTWNVYKCNVYLRSNAATTSAVGNNFPPFCYWDMSFLDLLCVHWRNLCFQNLTVSLAKWRVCWVCSHRLKCMFYMLGSASASTGLTVGHLQASAKSQLHSISWTRLCLLKAWPSLRHVQKKGKQLLATNY